MGKVHFRQGKRSNGAHRPYRWADHAPVAMHRSCLGEGWSPLALSSGLFWGSQPWQTPNMHCQVFGTGGFAMKPLHPWLWLTHSLWGAKSLRQEGTSDLRSNLWLRTRSALASEHVTLSSWMLEASSYRHCTTCQGNLSHCSVILALCFCFLHLVSPSSRFFHPKHSPMANAFLLLIPSFNLLIELLKSSFLTGYDPRRRIQQKLQ